MRGLPYWGTAVALAAGLAACVTPTSSGPEIVGRYDLAGQTADAKSYEGDLSITSSNQIFYLDGHRSAFSDTLGYGLRLGDVLGVTMADADEDFGIVLYRVSGGHLEGIWRYYDVSGGRLGKENLDGPAGLEGTYKISRGRNPGGDTYAGRVKIRRTGQTYMVDWFTPQPHSVGIGVLLGDIFVVGYARKHRPGVAAYCLNAANFPGVIAAGNDTALGAEILWAQGKPAPGAIEGQLSALRKTESPPVCGAAQ